MQGKNAIVDYNLLQKDLLDLQLKQEVENMERKPLERPDTIEFFVWNDFIITFTPTDSTRCCHCAMRGHLNCPLAPHQSKHFKKTFSQVNTKCINFLNQGLPKNTVNIEDLQKD
jgi:hypothetical protein